MLRRTGNLKSLRGVSGTWSQLHTALNPISLRLLSRFLGCIGSTLSWEGTSFGESQSKCECEQSPTGLLYWDLDRKGWSLRALTSSRGLSFDGIKIKIPSYRAGKEARGQSLASVSRSLGGGVEVKGHVSKLTKLRINPEPIRWIKGLRYLLPKPEALSSNPGT